MNAVVTDNLPLIAGAPNGIQKLRELILELAVRGKLVPQDPNDEPASELLKRIAEEKELLIKAKAIRSGKSLPEIEHADTVFTLPVGWEWVRLGQIGDWGAGATPARGNPNYYGGTMPWFKSGELVADFIFSSEETVTELALKECSLRRNKPGDVLIAMYGATIGKTSILNVEGTTNQAVCACTPFNGVSNRYLLLTLKALKPNFIGQGAGGAQPNISREKIVATVAGLPPLAEQRRIVAKVDELMTLCDRLEAQQADAESAHARLVQALLDSLTQATDADDPAASWQRLAEHFHTLFSTESSIDALKQTLLQLAVMGKLVPQDPSDEPASELLKRIAEEKARLAAKGEIKKQKPLAEIREEEKPFELPRGWSWVRLDLLLSKIGAGSTPLGGKQAYVAEGIKFLRSQNVWNEGLRLNEVAMIPEAIHQKMAGTHVYAGDLLFNITGASIGRCALVPDDFDEGNVSQHVTIIRPLIGELRLYLHIVLYSPLVQQTVMDVQVGVSREGLSIGKLAQFVIPFPPMAEQHRIVAKVNELMTLCDLLKARLTQARQLNEQLASVLVEKTVA